MVWCGGGDVLKLWKSLLREAETEPDETGSRLRALAPRRFGEAWQIWGHERGWSVRKALG